VPRQHLEIFAGERAEKISGLAGGTAPGDARRDQAAVERVGIMGSASQLPAPRSRQEEIHEEICDELRPLTDGAKKEIRARLELFNKVCKSLSGIKNAKAINKAARELRVVLVNTFLGLFEEQQAASCSGKLEWFGGLINEELFTQLLWLEKISGPAANSNPLKWFDAEFARILIKDFSNKKLNNDPNGALRSISTLIHEYRTGKPGTDFDFENACEAVLKAAKKYRGIHKKG
jgi:hypothetical protein